MSAAPGERIVRIGAHSAFWGDSASYARQFVERARVDYLVGDYLSEITMSLLARAKDKHPDAGYAVDFVETIAPMLGALRGRETKIVTNAGGLNPRACRDALRAAAGDADVKIAVVEGDDLLAQTGELRERGVREMYSGVPLPAQMVSVNAYLGAFPVAAALAAGADVVICGRIVDSALALGPLIHEFGWNAGDYDILAAGSLAGHVIECGAQATGGIFTDWRDVPGWDDMGMPIAECDAGGGIVVTKPAGTGGIVTPATVAEQIVYEIGDPRAYALPDVVCDFSNVALEPAGPDRVRVSGARGRPPLATYKVSATHADGFRVLGTMLVAGGDAAARARRTGHAILTRAARILTERGMAPFTETSIEVAGGGDIIGEPLRTDAGAGADAGAGREAVLKIGARHPDRAALELLSREIAPAGCAMAQGLTGLIGGRPAPSPVVRLFSFSIDRAIVRATIDLDGTPLAFAEPRTEWSPPDAGARGEHLAAGAHRDYAYAARADRDRVAVPLRWLAWGRSGDKGDACNIGVIARQPAFVAPLAEQLTAQRVAQRFAYAVHGSVRRYELPGFDAFNFVMENALGGGGIASLRYDPQGKSFAQILLDEPILVPASWVNAAGDLDAGSILPGAARAELSDTACR